ncbi:DUF4232 domain-containing protein [Streptomyces sp. NPDC101150]|uniref:DUF4232 domain-containing protein n=1 Tax=Streptomyces sp. NPDC101150 TaxID=3366114 RepID=UPI003828123B
MSHGTTTLHRGRKAAAATLIAAAAIALTAYQDTEADAAGAPSTATGGTATGKYAFAPDRTAGDRCTTDHLKAGWGTDGGGRPDMHSDNQQTVGVWLKNTGSGDCTLAGFPGVELVGNSGPGDTFDLRRGAQQPVTVHLKPGEHTSFTFKVLPSLTGSEKRIEPGRVNITPPNEKKHLTLRWPFGGAVLDQRGATHPGSWVSPIGVG